MAEFLRVRSKVPGHPLHEFDVPTSWVGRHPDRYEVIDSKPVAKQRPASHIPGVVVAEPVTPAPKSAKPAKKRANSPGEDSIAPSEGLPKEETHE